MLDEAKSFIKVRIRDKALDYPKTLLRKLEEKNISDSVMIDLGLVNRSNYYTGVIFRGYAEGSGATILSGGRYDNLIAEFGLDVPAIGFGVDVNALCDAKNEIINVERPVRIALTKAGLKNHRLSFFKRWGSIRMSLRNKGRRLILPVDKYEAVLSKAPDVITYVEHGVCDIGVVGKDTIVEHGSSFYEVMDLNLGKCRFVLPALRIRISSADIKRKTVASKYPKVARDFF